ncbi:hypothetical protein JX265_007007 [Neoarthrinium moseri]|uniref:Uncharacterized protein n=1 Tax=Neoarthrinium moseri TaxID=1658444 RepID=A0A9Q0ANG0_9PEZI|nr:hypothetical protein JX265_007007 [Neoarthrinium moseri]
MEIKKDAVKTLETNPWNDAPRVEKFKQNLKQPQLGSQSGIPRNWTNHDNEKFTCTVSKRFDDDKYSEFLSLLRRFILSVKRYQLPENRSRPGNWGRRMSDMSNIILKAYKLSLHTNDHVASWETDFGNVRNSGLVIDAIQHLSKLERSFYDFVNFSRLPHSGPIELDLLTDVPNKLTWVKLADLSVVAGKAFGPQISDCRELRDMIKKWRRSKEKKISLSKHCEMQLYEYFNGRDSEKRDGLFDYMGTSKLPCWACWCVLRFTKECIDREHHAESSGVLLPCTFTTQESHRKFYRRWQAPDISSQGHQAEALHDLTNEMDRLLADCTKAKVKTKAKTI